MCTWVILKLPDLGSEKFALVIQNNRYQLNCLINKIRINGGTKRDNKTITR